MFLGERINAAEAHRLNLVNQVVPDAELEDRTRAVVERLANGPALAYRLIKRNLNLAETVTFEQRLEIEAANMVRSILSDDSREAVRAFLEKREPRFNGRWGALAGRIARQRKSGQKNCSTARRSQWHASQCRWWRGGRG